MCGICGFTDSSKGDMSILRTMNDAMVHRGPDDAGYWLDQGTGLGARRLAILDPAHSRQPLSDEEGRVQVVVNGEIYNYRDLRAELETRGHRFRTEGDGEVIAHLYEDVGMDLLPRLRGMFAFALFDRSSDTLYLARDRFGIKPLFWADTLDGGLAFASDIRSLLSSGLIPPAVNAPALWHYFTYQYVPGRDTLFARIKRLPGGHYLKVRHGMSQEFPYFKPVFAPDESLDAEEVRRAIRTALETSVRLHLQSDMPVGAFLSSGVDSSTVVALMRRHGSTHTFSVAFEGASGERDERSGARVVAEALGTDHHEIHVSAEAYRDAWPEIVRAMEDPVADPAAPGIYFLSQEAAHYVRVVLSGEGADELFGGYPIYHQPHDLRAVSSLPPALKKLARHLAHALPPGRPGRSYIERATRPLERLYLGGAKLLEGPVKETLLGPWARTLWQDPYDVAAEWYAGTEHLDPATRMQAIDLHGWLAGDILVKADKMSMAHSIEVRVPYLDPQVWNVAREIPTRLKLKGHETKQIFREAVSDLLPGGAAMRPKLGFPVPLRSWIRGVLRDYVEDVAQSYWPEGWLDRDTYSRMLRENATGQADWSRTIYAVTTFALWHHAFMAQEGQTCNQGAASTDTVAR